MKWNIFKYACVFIIVMFCLAPLGAIDLNEDNNTKYIGPKDNESSVVAEEANVTACDDEKDMKTAISEDSKTTAKDKAQEETNSKDLENSSVDYASVHVNDIYEGQTANVEVRTDESVNEAVWISIKDKSNRVMLENGYASLAVSDLAPGTYTVNIFIEGIQVKNSTSFRVKPLEDPNLRVEAKDINPPENAFAEIYIDKSYSGQAYVSLDGGKAQKAWLSNGYSEVYVGYELLPGQHSIEVNTSASGNFKQSSANTTFTVSKVPHIYPLTNDILDGEDLIVSIRTASQYNGLVYCYLEDGTLEYGYAKNGIFKCTFSDMGRFSSGFHHVRIVVQGDGVFDQSVLYHTYYIR